MALMPVTISVTLPMPPRSAPILTVLATTSRAHAPHRTHFEYWRPDHAGESLAGHHSEPRAHHLHSGHQRKRKESRPERSVAERSAGDRIGGDSRRVVVGGPSNQAGSQAAEKPPRATRYDAWFLLVNRTLCHSISFSRRC